MPGISKVLKGELQEEEEEEPDQKVYSGKSVETYFVAGEIGIKKQDVIQFTDGEETLLGIHVPFFFCLGNRKQEDDEEADEEKKKMSYSILRNTMKEFYKLENVDEDTKTAIMNFSYFLTTGNLDEAYNSVRNIQNVTVWQAIAAKSR